jgi:thymidylate synthase ThyX
VPPIDGEARAVFERAVVEAWESYARLSAILKDDTFAILKRLRNIPPTASPDRLKALEKEAEKKAIETARYVIPLAAFTAMVHTISGITLYRLMRMAQASDTPHEAREVIGAMVDAVRRHDPAFVERVDVVGLRPPTSSSAAPGAARRADAFAIVRPQPRRQVAQLVDWSSNAEVVADASGRLRRRRRRPDHRRRPRSAAQPGPQPVSARHDPGRLPLAADAVAAARQLHVPEAPQPHRRLAGPAAPDGAGVAAADDVLGYRPARLRDAAADPGQSGRAGRVREGHGRGLGGQEPPARAGRADRVRALRPAQRQGDPLRRVRALIALLHKWTMRTCFNAQEEIYEASMEEVAQVRAVHPRLARFIGPPCVVRNGLVSPRCTEGSKFCGVPVWRDFPRAVRPL